jgi:hypothetical protein
MVGWTWWTRWTYFQALPGKLAYTPMYHVFPRAEAKPVHQAHQVHPSITLPLTHVWSVRC